MNTTITFHFTDTLAKRKERLAQAGATKKNTTLNIRGLRVRYTGNEADLAVANEATVNP